MRSDVRSRIGRHVRRTVFGRDPESYDRNRLAYPPRVFDILTRRCGLRPGASVFEIGPGTGIATRELLRRGADPLTLIEADRRLVRYLRAHIDPHGADLRIRSGPFERVALPEGAFDLGVAASSFHWVPPRRGLSRVADALRPGGWWAFWGNHHGDPYRPTPFHRALDQIYRDLRGGGSPIGQGWATDRRAREADAKAGERWISLLRSVGSFERVRRDNIHWHVTLGTAQVLRLWATFSDTVTLPPRTRQRFLSELGALVEGVFGGRVSFSMLTPMYTARRV